MFSRKILTLLFFTSILFSSEVIEYNPQKLITPERADIMAKYIYAKQRDWETSCDFGLKIYHEHLKVWNNFWEADPCKRTFEDFQIAFDAILSGIKGDLQANFPPIPVNQNGIIPNGSHRLTACLLYNKPVKTTKIQCNDFCVDLNFFKKINLDEKYLDAMALQYCELKPDCYVMTIFPSARGHEKEIFSILKKYAKIVYHKNLFLTENGALNLLLTAYRNEAWIGNSKNNYSGVQDKLSKCFPKKFMSQNPMRVYLLEAKNLLSIQKCKAKIRSLFKIQNDSVHTTDSYEQAIILARALFNKNSIHCLNYRKINSYSNFNKYINLYKNWIKKNQYNEEWFCIDSSGVLAAYGLRDCNDLDFLHYNEILDSECPSNIGSHNFQSDYYNITKENILFDPEYYFFYNGVKFCSLPLVKKMKLTRREKKDLQDVDLIEMVLKKE